MKHKNLATKLACNKGRITVEAALIFPIILFSIVAVIFICLCMYQSSYLQSIADGVACEGAAYWDDLSKLKQLKVGKCPKMSFSQDLYWQIYDSKKNEKIDILTEIANQKLKNGSLLKGESVSNDDSTQKVFIEYKNDIISRKIEVTIRDSYKFPLIGTVNLFGKDFKVEIIKKSIATIDDNAQVIRDVDFMLDVTKQLKSSDKVKQFFENVKDSISKFKK